MERRHTPRYSWDNGDRGSDSFVIFQYTAKGEGRFSFAGREHRVPAGHAFIAVVPEPSRYYFPEEGGPEWAFSWVNFYGDLALRLWGTLRDRVGPVVALRPEAARKLETLVSRTARSGPRAWRDHYEASGAAYAFYLDVLRDARPPQGSPSPSQPLARALAYLRGHYQAPLRIKEVAALAGMSREHFTRLFFRQAGVSPASFLRGVRL
ncbi:MAG TPA: AraC family ligand binding domain-containing protein, partial [Candidatus Methylacidiphilales bacterium]